MTKRLFIFLLVVLALALAIALPVAAQDSSVPRFEESVCPFDVPSGQNPTCGYLIVPEDRGNPDSGTIKIAAAVFKSSCMASAKARRASSTRFATSGWAPGRFTASTRARKSSNRRSDSSCAARLSQVKLSCFR